MRLKFSILILIILFPNASEATQSCSNSDFKKIEACVEKYYESLSANKKEGKYYALFPYVTKTIPGFKNICQSVQKLKQCLENSKVDHCVKTDDLRIDEFQYMNEALIIHMCSIEEDSFSCYGKMASKCEIDESNCNTLEKTVESCELSIIEICKLEIPLFTIFEMPILCHKHSECPMCSKLTNLMRTSQTHFKNLKKFEDDGKVLFEYLQLAKTSDTSLQVDYVSKIHRLLQDSSKKADYKNEVVEAFVELLKSDNMELQIKILHAFYDFTTAPSEYPETLIRYEAVPHLIKLLESQDFGVLQYTLLTFSNIINGRPKIRDYCINNGLIESLIGVSNRDVPVAIFNHVAAIMYRICQDKPVVSHEIVFKFMPFLQKFLSYKEEALIDNTLSTLSFIILRSNKPIQLLIDLEMIERIIPFLDNRYSYRLNFWAFAIVRNIAVKGTDEQVHHIIDLKIMDFIMPLLKNPKFAQDSLNFLSNILALYSPPIEEVINGNFIPVIMNYLSDADPKISEAALDVIVYFAAEGNSQEIKYLISQNIVPELCRHLSNNALIHGNLLTLTKISETIDKEDRKIFLQQLQASDCMDVIDNLKGHEEHLIRREAHKLKNSLNSSAENSENDAKTEKAEL